MKLFLGEALLPCIPVALIYELGATITIELYDIGLGRKDPSPVLGQGSGAVNDKGRRYLDRLDLSPCQVEEFCSDSDEGMRECYFAGEVGNEGNNVFVSAVQWPEAMRGEEREWELIFGGRMKGEVEVVVRGMKRWVSGGDKDIWTQ